MAVDIACVGFGPAMGGFLTTLARRLAPVAGDPAFASRVAPGMPLQVVCYERADDLGFGVSGAVTRGRAIRATFPDLDVRQIPAAEVVRHEKLVYLLDPIGASRRSRTLVALDRLLRGACRVLPLRHEALEFTAIPPFLRKDDGFILAIGQFNQWVASELFATGQVQIWPGMPVQAPLVEGERVVGIALADQGVDAAGRPAAGYLPGMHVHAGLTVVGDGPVGAVGRGLDAQFGRPQGHEQRDWAVGMKMVVELPDTCALEPGTVLHTIGYPEPEIFGFLYVTGPRTAALGIFVPSWFETPARTAYRTLQHWMLHPYLWRHLRGGTMRSWGAKSLLESGRRGEPHLVGDGFARIGEGSGTTNVLTGSGVDEAWMSGVLLAEGVIDLLRRGADFTRDNLVTAYVERRRQSWLDAESRAAAHARDGFQRGFVTGLLGMALAGWSRGRVRLPRWLLPAPRRTPSLESSLRGRMAAADVQALRRECAARGVPLHDAILERCGWPEIAYDGQLLVSHQDALLLGGKVQAPGGYADHLRFKDVTLCERCQTQRCVEMCSGQALMPGDGAPRFDREKCVHCGACLWNCTLAPEGEPDHGNILFTAGAGGLHSAEN